MSYALKTTGLPSELTACVMADQDGLLTDLVSGKRVSSGMSVSGNASATCVTSSWKADSTIKGVVLGAVGALSFDNGPAVSGPCTIMMIIKGASQVPGSSAGMVFSAATANGSFVGGGVTPYIRQGVSVAVPLMYHTQNAFPISLCDEAAPLATTGENYAFAVCSYAVGNATTNPAYFTREANSTSAVRSFAGEKVAASGQFMRAIATDTANGWGCSSVLLWLKLPRVMTQAEFDGITADIKGYLLAAAAGPVITGPTGAAGAASISISRPDNQATAGTWTATNSVSWSLSGTNAALLAISAGGVVTKLTGNFNAGVQASYSFNVVNGSASQAVTMTITDATNPTWTGALSASAITSSGAVITGSGTPADNVALGVRQYRINGGTWTNNDSAGASQSATVAGLSASSTYTPEMSILDTSGNRSTPTLVMPGAGTFTTLAPSGASVTVRLFTDVAQTIPAINLTGLKISVWEFASVDLITAPPFFRTGSGTSNSSGDAIIAMTGTSLLSGALCVVGIQDSAGNRFFLGSVPVA